MREGPAINGRLRVAALAAWIAVTASLLSAESGGAGRFLGVVMLLGVVLGGLMTRGWAPAIGVGVIATTFVAGWAAIVPETHAPSLLGLLGVALTGLLAAWARPAQLEAEESRSAPYPADTASEPAPTGLRLPPGVADEGLLDRLAVHEMTRARRYERPMALLLVGVDGWSTLSAERGHKQAYELLSVLAVRIRRLLRDVDAIGVHGDGQLALLLPETPLDGASVVAGRIEQVAQDEVGVHVRVGIAVFPDDAGTVEALQKEAEAALDLARRERVAIVRRVQLA